MLYVVGTPIGNLEDITMRALRVLREVSVIAAEDTRTTRRLLSHFGISTPLTAYYEHNKLAKLDHLLEVSRTEDVALVSEAGMPGISDPGYELVREAVKRGIQVVPVPGPSAVVTALAISGLPTDQFLYLGFLPRRSTERSRALGEVKDVRQTMVVYEAPHRLLDSLKDVLSVLGDRQIAVCRELTKLHEEVIRGSVSYAIAHFEQTSPLGEITLVVAGSSKATSEAASVEDIRRSLLEAMDQGLSSKEAVALVAQRLGVPKRLAYQEALRLKGIN